MDKEQYDILKQGVDVWNKWRKGHPDIKIDFSGVDLKLAKLSGVDFSGIDLSEADFSGADLREADFSRANLIEADLSRADLNGANLSGAGLSGADLIGADLNEADIIRAGLIGANLIQADLSRADAREADLSGANLIGANLVEADLREADLRRANLVEADLSRADLREADLREVNLSEANLMGADLTGANLSKADLSSAYITGAYLFVTSRDYWKIENIKCNYIFWDAGQEERTPKDRDFFQGEFERLYSWKPLNEFERLIERYIEFPPEYKQAGISILNFFSEILREKYPEANANVQIKQDGLKVTLIIDPVDGERKVIEETLNEFALVISGKKTPEAYAGNNELFLIELKSQLNFARSQLESQQLIIEYQHREIKKQDVNIKKLLSIVGNAVKTPHNFYINTKASGGKMGNDSITISAKGDVAFGKDQAIVTINKMIQQSSASDELKVKLDELTKAVEAMIQEMPQDKAEDVKDDLELLVKGAAQNKPKWYSVSGEGLIEAAKALGSLGKPVIDTTQAILKMLP